MNKVISKAIHCQGQLEEVYQRISEALKTQGFGILTKIDFHQKIQEKVGKTIPPTIILGACHPQLAFEAYQINPAITNLMPCNVALQEVSPQNWRVEFALAQPILKIFNDERLQELAHTVDEKIMKVATLLDS